MKPQTTNPQPKTEKIGVIDNWDITETETPEGNIIKTKKVWDSQIEELKTNISNLLKKRKIELEKNIEYNKYDIENSKVGYTKEEQEEYNIKAIVLQANLKLLHEIAVELLGEGVEG